MKLCEALDVQKGDIVCLVGGGGKTTALRLLKEELTGLGWKVSPTTTTRLGREEAEGIEGLVLAGLEGNKALGIAPEEVAGLLQERDAVIVEADGSRGRPLKAPAEHEPALPHQATLVVVLVGAEAIDAPFSEELVHRPERFSALTALEPGQPLTPRTIAWVVSHPRGGLKDVPPEASVAVLINKVDDPGRLDKANELARALVDEPRIERVVLASLLSEEPVRELYVNSPR